MNEPIDIILGNSLCNTFCPFDMNILKIKVPMVQTESNMPRDILMLTYLVGYIRPTRLYTTSECRTLSSRDCVFLRSYSFGSISPYYPQLQRVLTMKMTLPRSPVTFRCLLAISSRYGTITVDPCLAVYMVRNSISSIRLYIEDIRVITKSIDNVASKESSCPKHGHSVSCKSC